MPSGVGLRHRSRLRFLEMKKITARLTSGALVVRLTFAIMEVNKCPVAASRLMECPLAEWTSIRKKLRPDWVSMM